MLQLDYCQAEDISCKISRENIYRDISIPCCLLFSRKGFLASLPVSWLSTSCMMRMVYDIVFICITQAYHMRSRERGRKERKAVQQQRGSRHCAHLMHSCLS